IFEILYLHAKNAEWEKCIFSENPLSMLLFLRSTRHPQSKPHLVLEIAFSNLREQVPMLAASYKWKLIRRSSLFKKMFKILTYVFSKKKPLRWMQFRLAIELLLYFIQILCPNIVQSFPAFGLQIEKILHLLVIILMY